MMYGLNRRPLCQHAKKQNTLLTFLSKNFKILLDTNFSKKIFQLKKSEEFASQPLKEENILNELEIAHLPGCLKNYLKYTGAIGKCNSARRRMCTICNLMLKCIESLVINQ